MISVFCRRVGPALEARITPPAGLSGEFVWLGVQRTVGPGKQAFRIE
jgi:hypothetical protein